MEVEEMVKKLEAREKRVERALELCREIKRKAARAIEKIVEGEETEVEFGEKEELEEILKEDPELLGLIGGSIRVAFQEMAEAIVVKEAVLNNRLVMPDVPEHSAITGLADAVGELKRYFLKSIIKGKIEEAQRVLALAEEGYRILAELSFSKTVVPELKRKRDVARGVVVSMLQTMAEVKAGR